MAKVTIGETTYIIGELNFIAMKKAWGAIQNTMLELDPMLAVGAAIEVIAYAIQEEPGFNPQDFDILADEVLLPHEVDARIVSFLERKLKATQIQNIQIALDEIITEAGLRPEEGEAEVPGSPGTEIQTPSLPSSSQPELKEVAGTA